MAVCHLCPADQHNVPDEDLLEHLRVVHHVFVYDDEIEVVEVRGVDGEQV